MREVISETMQDSVLASQMVDGSTLVDEHISQNDATREDPSTQQASSKSPAAVEDHAMQHGSDVGIDKHISMEIDQGSRLGDVDHSIENVCQQTGDNNHSQMIVSVEGKDAEKTPDKSVEGTGGLTADNCTQEDEEIVIQEDDLVKTVLEVFEARHLIETRPIPVLVKGKEVDLVQLSFQVRACGGFNQVTLWSSISKSLGFGQECGPLLKLVYVKYLKCLEHRRLIANQVVQGSQNVPKKENEDIVKESVRSQLKNRAITSTRKRSSEDGPTIDNCAIDTNASLFAEGSEPLAGVLEWVKRLALNPGDPKKGQGVRVSRWSEAWAGKCETLAGRVREVLWKKNEHPLHDLSPSEIQDLEPERRKRGRGHYPRVKSAGKKARRSSS